MCIHDMLAGQHPRQITAGWVYLRFHGGHCGGSYSSQTLQVSTRGITACLDRGLDLYEFFNNDAHGSAVENAHALRRFVNPP